MILDPSGPDRVLLADQLFARMDAGATRSEAAEAIGLSAGQARRMAAAFAGRRNEVHAEVDETIRAAPTTPTLPAVRRPLPVAPEFSSREEIVSFWGAALHSAQWCEVDGVASARLAALRAWDLAHPPTPPVPERELTAAEQEVYDEADDLLWGPRTRRFPGMYD